MIAAHPIFIVGLCFAVAMCFVLVALVWALSHIRSHVPWASGSTSSQQPPTYVGIPTAWRRANEQERWN